MTKEMKNQTTLEPFRLLSVFYFDDDTVSYSPLCVGTLAECRHMMAKIPAISYSGDKNPKESILKICDGQQWQELERLGHA